MFQINLVSTSFATGVRPIREGSLSKYRLNSSPGIVTLVSAACHPSLSPRRYWRVKGCSEGFHWIAWIPRIILSEMMHSCARNPYSLAFKTKNHRFWPSFRSTVCGFNQETKNFKNILGRPKFVWRPKTFGPWTSNFLCLGNATFLGRPENVWAPFFSTSKKSFGASQKFFGHPSVLLRITNFAYFPIWAIAGAIPKSTSRDIHVWEICSKFSSWSKAHCKRSAVSYSKLTHRVKLVEVNKS